MAWIIFAKMGYLSYKSALIKHFPKKSCP